MFFLLNSSIFVSRPWAHSMCHALFPGVKGITLASVHIRVVSYAKPRVYNVNFTCVCRCCIFTQLKKTVSLKTDAFCWIRRLWYEPKRHFRLTFKERCSMLPCRPLVPFMSVLTWGNITHHTMLWNTCMHNLTS